MEKDEKSVERITALLRFPNKKQQLNCTTKTFQENHRAVSQYRVKEEIANFETKKKRPVAPILMKTKGSKHVVECQIDIVKQTNFKKVNPNFECMTDQS